MINNENIEKALNNLRTYKRVILQWPTGVGKGYFGAKAIQELKPQRCLLLVAETFHKKNWQEEFEKQGVVFDIFQEIVIECYASLKKYEATQWDTVLLDECFRGDMEVLTNSGYKQFKDLTESDLVAQFTQDGNIEFVKPIRLIKRKHVGEICKMHLGRGRYCYLTPNHNMVYRTKSDNEWKFKPVKDFARDSYKKIPVSGKGTGNNLVLTPLERLFVAIQADGALQRHQINESVYSIQIKKERKKKRLSSILSRLNNWSKINGKTGFDRYLVKLPKGDAKLLKTHFDVNMGYYRANSFIEEVLQWDGHECKNANIKYYSSKIKENADFVAAVAVQAGYKVLNSVEYDNRKDNYSPMHRVFMRKTSDVSVKPIHKEYLPYDDYVYCVEVPSHMIVVRAEGYSFIAGNCHHAGSELRTDILKTIKADMVLCLSATLDRDIIASLESCFGKFYIDKISISKAIEQNMLPVPKIYTIPLALDNTNYSETITETWGNKLKRVKYKCKYTNRWAYKKNKSKYPNVELEISCTQKQKYLYICEQFEFWKQRYFQTKNQGVKNLWMQMGNQRKIYLGSLKTNIVKDFLETIYDKRYICFCTNIQQADEIGGENAIHTKAQDNEQKLYEFNIGIRDHIFAVSMLREGQNLNNIEAGIIVQTEGVELSTIQRIGRILRSKEPIIYIFYYEGTRDEEFVRNALKDIDSKYIQQLTL